VLREPVSLVLGPDETLHTRGRGVRRFLDDTAAGGATGCAASPSPRMAGADHPAAITLKLNAYEDTGAIVAP